MSGGRIQRCVYDSMTQKAVVGVARERERETGANE